MACCARAKHIKCKCNRCNPCKECDAFTQFVCHTHCPKRSTFCAYLFGCSCYLMCLLIAFVGGYYKERVDGHLESGYNAILFFVTLFVVLCAFIILVFVCMCCKEYAEERAKFHANDQPEEESVLSNPYADDVPLDVFTL